MRAATVRAASRRGCVCPMRASGAQRRHNWGTCVDFPEHGYGTRCSTVLVASAATEGWDLAVQEVTHAHRTDDRPGTQNIRLSWS